MDELSKLTHMNNEVKELLQTGYELTVMLARISRYSTIRDTDKTDAQRLIREWDDKARKVENPTCNFNGGLLNLKEKDIMAVNVEGK
jgi:hypothetical protein